MEFLSEDLYGGYYSGLPEAQPWYSMQGLTSPYGVYGLNRAGLLAQQNLPVDASGMLNIGVNVDTQAIQDQVEQNLSTFNNDDEGQRIEEFIENWIRETTPRGGGVGPTGPGQDGRVTGVADPSGMGSAIRVAIDQGRLVLNEAGELVEGPNYDPEGEEASILSRYKELTSGNEETQQGQEQEIGEQEESIDSPLTGDPGDLFEPDTGFEPDTDFPAPTQQGVNLEDFQTQFPDLNVEDYEDGMYTDPRTGTVYVMNIPPGGIPKETEGEGEGEGGSGNGAGGNGSGGEGGEGQQGQEGQGEAGQAGQTGTSGTTDQTRETGNIPDYSDIGDPNYGDDRIPPGDRGVIDDYRPRDPGFQIIAGVPFIGNGSGVEGSSGGSSSGGGDGGMLSQNKFKFTPYTASVRGVNAPQVNVIGGQPQRQSIMGMFREYLT